ncbi:MAG: hypothetical protein RPR28_07790 [Cycloclasticus sp.]
MLSLFILENKKVVEATDMRQWVKASESKSRIVQQDWLTPRRKPRWLKPNDVLRELLVSTVFLTVPHGANDYFFETMVFNEGNDELQERHRTWDEALKYHKKLLIKIKRERSRWIEN